jgi:two-component sensor histidine kinase
VALSWSIHMDGRAVEIVWREAGGPPVEAPARKGFGSRLLAQGLTAELGQPAALVFAPEGVTCTVTAPLAEG